MLKTLEELLQRKAPAARTREVKRPVGKALLVVGAVVLAIVLVTAALIVS